MLLEVYEKSTRKKVELIRNWSYVQYTKEISGEGSFTINVSATDKSLKYLVKHNMILFEEGAMGVIKSRRKERGKDSYFVISGEMLSCILEYRTFKTTQTYSGKLAAIVKDMLTTNFINPTDAKRKVSLLKFSTTTGAFPNSEQEYSIQYTGKKVSYGIQDILQNESWGYDIVPVLAVISDDTDANLTGIEFSLVKPVDHTMDNTKGNPPVVFSYKNGNMKNIAYSEDATTYANVMIVAGEGEGTERTVVEVGDTEATDWDRIEEYVDARDLQKQTDTDTILTDEQYNELLVQRGRKKQEEHVTFVSLTGTAISSSTLFKYGEDYKLGDFVSVVDESMGLVADVQITSISKYHTKSSIIMDIGFGYEKSTVRSLLRKDGVI